MKTDVAGSGPCFFRMRIESNAVVVKIRVQKKTEIFLNLLKANWLLKCIPLHTFNLLHRMHPGLV